MDSSDEGYKPDKDFEENTKDPLLDITLNDSTELWLIQWPLNKLKPDDFDGKRLSLKMHHDGKLGSFDSSSGKSYDVVSFAAQEPDATVFLPSSSESTIVGKISRQVCLVRYPEPDEYEMPSFTNPSMSSHGLEGSRRKSSQRSTVLNSRRDSLTSAYSMGDRSLDTSQPSRKKRHEHRTPTSAASNKSAERSSRASGPESHNTSGVSEQSYGEKSKKKKKVEE